MTPGGTALRCKKNGVILLNMGGPDTLDDVRPFLYNLFSDREIIRLGPFFLQKFLAHVISRRRAPKSRAIYEQVGGGSPLKNLTLSQAKALEDELASDSDGDWRVAIAMRYWPPHADSALQQMRQQGISRITALPLYPHYSRATTGSSLRDLHHHMKQLGSDFELTTIPSYPTQPSYIEAIVDNINEGLEKFNGAEVEIVYSAHSLPVSFIDDGDPYVKHIKETINAIEILIGRTGRLCYQSRSGPVEWLSPSTPEMLESLAAEGCKNILMVPISFVSDHVETLYEISILYRKQAEDLGMRLIPSKSLNCHPLFIKGLKELVLQQKVQ
jgi:ferrochelatase